MSTGDGIIKLIKRHFRATLREWIYVSLLCGAPHQAEWMNERFMGYGIFGLRGFANGSCNLHQLWPKFFVRKLLLLQLKSVEGKTENYQWWNYTEQIHTYPYTQKGNQHRYYILQLHFFIYIHIYTSDCLVRDILMLFQGIFPLKQTYNI